MHARSQWLLDYGGFHSVQSMMYVHSYVLAFSDCGRITGNVGLRWWTMEFPLHVYLF